MFAEERQQKILDQIRKNGAVTTAGLMEHFGVSIETVRRDLLQMEQAGQLRRVHGGAVTAGGVKPFQARGEREQLHGAQKASLAAKAMEFLSEGDVIGVDAGSSTALYFARALKAHFRRMTVITCSLDVFEILHDYAEFKVILCGGYFQEKERSFYGTPAADMLSRLFMQKSFIFPAALSLEYGLHDHQDDLYPAQRQMMASSGEIYVLADSSKFEHKALLKVADMKRSFTYITDYDLSENLMRLYAQSGLKVYKGEEPPAAGR